MSAKQFPVQAVTDRPFMIDVSKITVDQTVVVLEMIRDGVIVEVRPADPELAAITEAPGFPWERVVAE